MGINLNNYSNISQENLNESQSTSSHQIDKQTNSSSENHVSNLGFFARNLSKASHQIDKFSHLFSGRQKTEQAAKEQLSLDSPSSSTEDHKIKEQKQKSSVPERLSKLFTSVFSKNPVEVKQESSKTTLLEKLAHLPNQVKKKAVEIETSYSERQVENLTKQKVQVQEKLGHARTEVKNLLTKLGGEENASKVINQLQSKIDDLNNDTEVRKHELFSTTLPGHQPPKDVERKINQIKRYTEQKRDLEKLQNRLEKLENKEKILNKKIESYINQIETARAKLKNLNLGYTDHLETDNFNSQIEATFAEMTEPNDINQPVNDSTDQTEPKKTTIFFNKEVLVYRSLLHEEDHLEEVKLTKQESSEKINESTKKLTRSSEIESSSPQFIFMDEEKFSYLEDNYSKLDYVFSILDEKQMKAQQANLKQIKSALNNSTWDNISEKFDDNEIKKTINSLQERSKELDKPVETVINDSIKQLTSVINECFNPADFYGNRITDLEKDDKAKKHDQEFIQDMIQETIDSFTEKEGRIETRAQVEELKKEILQKIQVEIDQSQLNVKEFEENIESYATNLEDLKSDLRNILTIANQHKPAKIPEKAIQLLQEKYLREPKNENDMYPAILERVISEISGEFHKSYKADAKAWGSEFKGLSLKTMELLINRLIERKKTTYMDVSIHFPLQATAYANQIFNTYASLLMPSQSP